MEMSLMQLMILVIIYLEYSVLISSFIIHQLKLFHCICTVFLKTSSQQPILVHLNSDPIHINTCYNILLTLFF